MKKEIHKPEGKVPITEQPSHYDNLERMSVGELLTHINEEDATVARPLVVGRLCLVLLGRLYSARLGFAWRTRHGASLHSPDKYGCYKSSRAFYKILTSFSQNPHVLFTRFSRAFPQYNTFSLRTNHV